MNIERMSGALQYPALLLVWSVGVVLVFANFYPADAALLRHQPVVVAPLAPLPSVLDDLEVNLEAALGTSEVLSGSWQPRTAVAEQGPVEPSGSPPDSMRSRPAKPDPAARDVAGTPPEYGPPVPEFARSMRPMRSVGKREPSARSPAADPTRLRLVSDAKRRARDALRAGDARRGWQLLMTHLHTGARDPEYLGLLAVISVALERIDEAMIIYKKLVAIEPGNARWWAGLAHCQERSGVDPMAGYRRVAELAGDGTALQLLALQRLAALSRAAGADDVAVLPADHRSRDFS